MKNIQFWEKTLFFLVATAISLHTTAQTTQLKESVNDYYTTSASGTFINYDANNVYGHQSRVAGIDDLVADRLYGHHWMGDVLGLEDKDSVFFVNVKTGEYLVLGNQWGETAMSDHAGTCFHLRHGFTCRADQAPGTSRQDQVDGDATGMTRADRIGHGFKIVLTNNTSKCLGRQQTSAGYQGAFEYMPILVTRNAADAEYADFGGNYNNQTPGHYVFHFYPVKGANGENQYVIFTHRQTATPLHFTNNAADYDAWKRLPEFWNRDSYLCLASRESDDADYNMVLYKKFAGKMWYSKAEGDTKFYWINRKTERTGRADIPNGPTNIEGLSLYLDGSDAAEGDEQNFQQRIVTLQEGLNAVKNDPACLWKIVTYKERKAYRLTGNIDHPVDVSFNIKNHKFYSTFGRYEIDQEGGSDIVDMGWNWYDGFNINASHHHPYQKAVTPYNEFHKIGTGYYDRWGIDDSETRLISRREERTMTRGLEANYVGSIFKGSAALEQTIENLRPGRYIVYCRAFYAPANIMKFDNQKGFKAGVSPTWEGSITIPSSVTSYITGETLSNKSFFYAKTTINNTAKEYRRKIPSIFEGMTPLTDSRLDAISRRSFIEREDTFVYTALGDEIFGDNGIYSADDPTTVWNRRSGYASLKNKDAYELMVDSFAFAMIPYNDQNYFVPRNLVGAGRFFNATDKTRHPEAQMYRIGLPVTVGADKRLTFGIAHENNGDAEEWVCFDDFELVYYGSEEHWEFILDESNPYNCSNFFDFFGWGKDLTGANIDEPDPELTAKVVLKRSLDPSKFVSIVLPVSLTRKQLEQAFGEDVKVSRLDKLQGSTIHFAAVTGGVEAGVPYIIKPSRNPIVGKGNTWTRTRFLSNPFGYDADGKNIYVPRKGRNNVLNSDPNIITMAGPIYMVDDVVINRKVVFHRDTTLLTGTQYYNTRYNGSKQWLNLDDYQPQGAVQISGDTSGKTYKLTARCYYDPLGTSGIPPYSYYFADGTMKFNGNQRTHASKGFGFYVQLLEYETPSAPAKPFTLNLQDFEWVEASGEATGIREAGSGSATADQQHYDLQGRRVHKPIRRGIYIVDGRKMVVK